MSSVPRGSGREPVAHVRLEVIRQQPGAVSAFQLSEAPSEIFTTHLSCPAFPGTPALWPVQAVLPCPCSGAHSVQVQLHCRLRAELCMAGAQQRTWGPVTQPGDTQRHSRSWQPQDSLRLFQLWDYKSPEFPLFGAPPWRHWIELLWGYLLTVQVNFKDLDIWDFAMENLGQASEKSRSECGVCSCEGALIPAPDWLPQWLLDGQTKKFP